MKTAKILIPIVIVASAAGFFLFRNQAPSPNSDIDELNPLPPPDLPGEPKPPTNFPPFPPSLTEPEGVLLVSDDPSQGNLMLRLDEPIGFVDSNSQVKVTYIRTSRDFSALVGKRVKAKFKAGSDPLGFVLDDIVPLE